MNELLYCIIFILVAIILAEAVIFFIVPKNSKKRKTSITKSSPVENIKILIEKDSIENINIFFDNLIREYITRYKILNGFTDESYVTTDMMNELNRYVSGSIMRNMTPSIRSTLGLIYNVSTDKALKETIDIRVKLNVIAEVIDQNQPLNE